MSESKNKSTHGDGWKSLLKSNEIYNKYGDNAIGLLGLSLKFDIDDLESAGIDSFVDGRNDKKNDFIYIDEEKGVAVIIQAYFSKSTKSIASANKASDLNTAVSWLLAAPEDDLPETIKAHAIRLRKGLLSGNIQKIYAWYVHNCTESSNVQEELDRVKQTLDASVHTHYKKSKIQTYVLEVGNSTLSDWYLQSVSPIFVQSEFNLNCPDGFEIKGELWKSFATHISARELYDIYKLERAGLFSANIRDYLGDRESDANINNGIKNSISDEPSDFWVFNNGLTILTNDFHFDKANALLKVEGLSIVNGAQTTGAIGNSKLPPKESARIPARFIKVESNTKHLVGKIVKYNNSQNKVTAADFRSNDSTQKRIIEEIEKIDTTIIYQGGRRGGAESAIKRNSNALSSFSVAQALAAFHGDPVIAYNKKSFLWSDDGTYSKYFNEKTTGAHIILCFSLLKRIEFLKSNLFEKSTNNDLQEADKRRISFFRKPGSVFVYIYAIRSCLEIVIQKHIGDYFALSFGNKSMVIAKNSWDPIISLTVPFLNVLDKELTTGLTSASVDRGIAIFRSLVEAYLENNSLADLRFNRALRNPSSR